ncbi:MAG: FAD-dependent oxidoreductase [Coriobacteriia bacterium]
MSRVDVLVLGGGPTGLGGAYQLSRHLGVDWMLCEAQTAFGGLSRSFVDSAGFTWDLGGHVFFSHYDFVSDLLQRALGPTGWFDHQREAWVRLGSSWIPYPFQNNLHRLPPEIRDSCLRGLVAAASLQVTSHAVPRNFASFIDQTFGRGIAEAFMTPYNEKVWAYSLDELSYEWIGERVSVPDVETVLANAAAGADDVDWGPNNRFMFPKSGGTGEFWSGVARLLPQDRIRIGAEAVAIDVEAKRVEFADGEVVSYVHLITTLPLDVTARMVGDSDLVTLTSGLKHSSVNVVGLGVDRAVGDRLGSRCWIYSPQRDIPFYRVTNFSHYSPTHVPPGSGCASLLVEVSESPHRPVDQEQLVDSVVRGLVSTGILFDPGEVFHTWTRRVAYAYPTPTLGRDEILDRALGLLESKQVYSRGRFGAWRYEVGNMDHSFAQGYEAAARILTGSAETTVWNPGLSNSRHPALGWGRLR